MMVPSGVHAITPGGLPTAVLVRRVDEVIAGGVTLVQYRDKHASAAGRRERAEQLQQLCNGRGVPLLINNDVQLAADIGAAGVHLGPEDTALTQARCQLGDDAVLGASCRGDAQLARTAATDADYLSFGCCFASRTKPTARPLEPEQLPALALLSHQLARPCLAVGGIDAAHLRRLSGIPLHAVAVCAALFDAVDAQAAARQLCDAFAELAS